MPGNQVAYRANKRESSLSAVTLRPCEPLAVILVIGQNPEIGGYFWIEKFLQHAPLGSPGADPSQQNMPFSSFSGYSAIVLLDSAVYLQIFF